MTRPSQSWFKNMDNPRITLRPIALREHAKALDLWGRVFPVGRSFFEQYYQSDPRYREGDTLGAWEDESRLVSAVHVCRRPLAWNGPRGLLCGGIANVATLPEFRGQGLSGRLLSAAILHMEQSGMDFSMLGTGIPDHYARLGWESLKLPEWNVTMPAEPMRAPKEALTPALYSAEILSLYNSSARSLQLARSPEYFAQWVGVRWRESNQQLALLRDQGYAVIEMGKTDDGSSYGAVVEFRARDAFAEREVLMLALQHIAPHANVAQIKASPQFNPATELEPLKTECSRHDSGKMIRNVGLTTAEYDDVKEAYLSGRATWWPSDHF
jgi:predicted acetyltransferase